MEEDTYCYRYPHPAVTTDCAIFGFDGLELNVLLVERGIEPFKGKWALPGGFLNINETAEAGARRELREETGLGQRPEHVAQRPMPAAHSPMCDAIFSEHEDQSVMCASHSKSVHSRSNFYDSESESFASQSEIDEQAEYPYMEQFHTYTSPHRDPRERVITIAYLALVKIQDVKGGDDASDARWFPISKVPPLAFDHEVILRDALARLRERIHFYPIGHDLLPDKFTIKELQALYEGILGTRFDRRNFAKKMFHLELLTELNQTIWPTPKREAKLFKFNLEKYNELKQRGSRFEF